jgi:hypothetical protein
MFHAHLAFHKMLLPELPDAPSTDTEAQLFPSTLRQNSLHAMPLTWEEKFADASKTTQNSTLIQLLDYMERQSDKDPPNTPTRLPSTDYKSEGSHSTCDYPEPNNKPCPLPGHSRHTIAQCRQPRYHEQQQADSDSRNSLSQAPQPSILCTSSNITPRLASKAYVSNVPPATTSPEDPTLSVQDAHLLDLF